MGTPSFQEFVMLMLLLGVLSMTGLWPRIARALRELRGDYVEDEAPSPSQGQAELCYKLLGVSPSAPWEEIERAYRLKAKVHHPDRGGDDDAMRALNDAYAQLKALRGQGR